MQPINYENRSLPPYYVPILMLEELNQVQFQHIGQILMLLGQHLVLEQDMLFKLYKRAYKQDLKLTFLLKAVQQKLVVQYQYNPNGEEQERYFYTLKDTAYHALELAESRHYKLPFFTFKDQKERILSYNQYILDNGLYPDLNYPLSKESYFFVAWGNRPTVCYYEDFLLACDVAEILISLGVKQEDIDMMDFIPIENKFDFGDKTRACNPKEVYD